MAASGSKTVELMNTVRARIAGRALGPGDRLPSVRRFAEAMAVSPSTVVEAYDRLVAEGLIQARRNAGFFVAPSNLPPLEISEVGAPRDREVDPFWVSRQALDTASDVSKPGCGWLPAAWMPTEAVRRALRGVARSDDVLLTDYGGTRGSMGLRKQLLGRFAEEGLNAGVDQVALTGSGTQAIDLVCRYFLRPGDTVVLDDPGYFNFHALLRAHPVRVVGVPFTAAGPDTEAFERVLAEHGPRLYITNSALHNPTGATLSPQTAHRIVSLAARFGVTVVEDEIFADFEPSPSPRLAALDGLDKVIRIGSFSKTLSASLRCGYIAARPDWIEGLMDLQVATSFGGPSPIASEVVSRVLSSGGYRKHMEDLRHRLDRARARTIDLLATLDIHPWIVPRGGFYLWCRLPPGRDSATVARRALREGLVLAPGNAFSVTETAASFLRFNIAQPLDDGALAILRRAMA